MLEIEYLVRHKITHPAQFPAQSPAQSTFFPAQFAPKIPHNFNFSPAPCQKACLRIRSREVNRDHVRSLQFKIGDRIFDPALSKSRDFYGLLISSKATESRGFIKLKSKFSIDDVEAKKAFSLIRSCICETCAMFSV